MYMTREDVAKIMVDATPGLIDVMADYIEEAMPDIAKEASKKALEELAPRRVEISQPGKELVTIPTAHKMLEPVLQAMTAECTVFLAGPAGSGKSFMARQCAKALSLPFSCETRVSHESKLLGHHDLRGRYHRTPFRERWEHGGVFLCDEICNGEADAISVLNDPLASRECQFPDAMVPAHEEFYFMAADNTHGYGGDRIYTGRNQLDGATLNRFVVYDIMYDENLEDQITDNPAWVARVRQVRRAIEKEKLAVIAGPRQSLQGCKLLAKGQAWEMVEEAVLWKGMDRATRARIERTFA